MLILDFNLLWGFLIVLNLLDNRKYEEITPPHVEDFCYITDNTYTREEVNVHLFWFNLYCSYYDFFFHLIFFSIGVKGAEDGVWYFRILKIRSKQSNNIDISKVTVKKKYKSMSCSEIWLLLSLVTFHNIFFLSCWVMQEIHQNRSRESESMLNHSFSHLFTFTLNI